MHIIYVILNMKSSRKIGFHKHENYILHVIIRNLYEQV